MWTLAACQGRYCSHAMRHKAPRSWLVLNLIYFNHRCSKQHCSSRMGDQSADRRAGPAAHLFSQTAGALNRAESRQAHQLARQSPLGLALGHGSAGTAPQATELWVPDAAGLYAGSLQVRPLNQGLRGAGKTDRYLPYRLHGLTALPFTPPGSEAGGGHEECRLEWR